MEKKRATNAESQVFNTLLAYHVAGDSCPIEIDLADRGEGILSTVWSTSYGKVRVNVEITDMTPRSPE